MMSQYAMNSNVGSDNEQMHSPLKYHIRVMTEDDVQQVLRIWRDNNLHEGTHTIQSFLKVDPEGVIVAVDDETGQLWTIIIIISFEFRLLLL